jgi:hypothetical protein
MKNLDEASPAVKARLAKRIEHERRVQSAGWLIRTWHMRYCRMCLEFKASLREAVANISAGSALIGSDSKVRNRSAERLLRINKNNWRSEGSVMKGAFAFGAFVTCVALILMCVPGRYRRTEFFIPNIPRHDALFAAAYQAGGYIGWKHEDAPPTGKVSGVIGRYDPEFAFKSLLRDTCFIATETKGSSGRSSWFVERDLACRPPVGPDPITSPDSAKSREEFYRDALARIAMHADFGSKNIEAEMLADMAWQAIAAPPDTSGEEGPQR